jgi:hypothetical protein
MRVEPAAKSWEELVRKTLGAAALAATIGLATGAQSQIIISGNDEKVTYNDDGQTIAGPPGKDTVSIIDISSRKANHHCEPAVD